MQTLPEPLEMATVRYRRAADSILETYAARAPGATSQVVPSQLDEGIARFLRMARQIAETGTGPARMEESDVSQLGDYGLTLLADLAAWAGQLELPAAKHELGTVMISVADWIIHHGGELRTLPALVDALAQYANRSRDANELATLVRFMGEIIDATAESIKQDLEKTNPGRPWRILHLNRGIVATRTHDPALMVETFDDLIAHLPEEAPRFFTEGMEQMVALDYPEHVCEVMRRYFDSFTRPRMH
jgi:hypothetical protein